MGFAGASAADEDRVALWRRGTAPVGQFANLPLVDRRVGEYEFVQVLEHPELGPADAIADRAGLPVRALGPDQAELAMSG